MFKGKTRLLGVSALVGAGLIAAGPAEAANFRLGGVDIQVDTTMSVGATWQLKESNSKFLPESNGGPAENNPNFDFVRDANGNIKYYDKTLLDADGAPKYLSKTEATREEALLFIDPAATGASSPGTANLATGQRPMDVATGAPIPKGGTPVLDYINGAFQCTNTWGGHCQTAPAISC